MKTGAPSKPSTRSKQVQSLTDVLGQSQLVESMVEEAGVELSTVNTELKQDLAGRAGLPADQSIVEKSEAIESKVQEAAEKLSDVNQALAEEVQERQALEVKLAEVTNQEEAARHASLHDPLTGLPNRALFDDRLAHALLKAERHGWTLAVLFLDIDEFKAINDTHGHDAGDTVLTTIAKRLKGNARGEDTVSRHGGDEFLYMLLEIGNEENAVPIVEKIINAIQLPFKLGTETMTVKASIGIALYPKDGMSAESLIKNADLAMYRAKRGKSGYAFAP